MSEHYTDGLSENIEEDYDREVEQSLLAGDPLEAARKKALSEIFSKPIYQPIHAEFKGA